MNDDEIDTLLEAAYREALSDPEGADIDLTQVALEAHMDLLNTYFVDLDVRGEATDQEIKRVEALRQSLICYSLLHMRVLLDGSLKMLSATDTTALTERGKQERARSLTELHATLVPLDEIEPLVTSTLASLGLPTTIEEFEDYDGNRCKINLNVETCTPISDTEFNKLMTVLSAIGS